jgi:hypothetical protein
MNENFIIYALTISVFFLSFLIGSAVLVDVCRYLGLQQTDRYLLKLSNFRNYKGHLNTSCRNLTMRTMPSNLKNAINSFLAEKYQHIFVPQHKVRQYKLQNIY